MSVRRAGGEVGSFRGFRRFQGQATKLPNSESMLAFPPLLYGMGRQARVILPGWAHHITQRGNRRQQVFFCDTDRKMYLNLLRDHASRAGMQILAYCLTPNHVHVVAIPERVDSLAKGFGRTHNEYARWVHIREHQTGHLWQNRFFSCPLDERHLAEALRYVELNPVRAGWVADPCEWAWSSAPARINGTDPYELLNRSAFRDDHIGENWKRILELGWTDDALQRRIRDATRTGRPLGNSEFLDAAERATGRSLRPAKRGPKPKPRPEIMLGSSAFS